MNSTVLKILGAIGTIMLSMLGMWIVTWADTVNKTMTKVIVIETLLPTMDAKIDVVTIDVRDIKKDVGTIREDVAKIRGKQ